MADFTFSELTPTAFLERSMLVFRDQIAVVDGELRLTYADLRNRCVRLAGGLRSSVPDDHARVGVLCANSHVMIEALHACAYAGLISVPLNTRLSVDELVSIAEHCGLSALVVTEETAELGRELAARTRVLVVADGPAGDYESLLQSGRPHVAECADERSVMSICYTSGTSGAPKGVEYHYRGQYLQSLAVMYHRSLSHTSKYLWTLPQFHCHGWSYVWALTGAGGTHICLRHFDPARAWQLIATEGVTHLSGAPTVLAVLAQSAPSGSRAEIDADTGGAPPSPTLLARLAALGISVTHLYGLTETYGPHGINQWQEQWRDLDPAVQASMRARQGVGNIVADAIEVLDKSGHPVPADATTVGEITCRGNTVALGYYNDLDATAAATVARRFRTGDLAVVHPDGYVQIVDRAKDIIITGGENVASVEVERVLDSHPGVLESAVVGRPDDKWGESVVAFVSVRAGAGITAAELADYGRERLAHYKVPREIHFEELPKTSTGKIRKDELRRRVASA
jgi:Acyl-CoA synthetases (AMP-forming)/AMP-acid ligases II